MNIRNRLALTKAGSLFTEEENDYIGYAYSFGGFLATAVCSLTLVVGSFMWFFPTAVGFIVIFWTLFGIWVQYAPVRRKKSNSTAQAITRYNSLGQDEKKMFPSNTVDILFKYNSTTANQKVIWLVSDIERARENATLPVIEDFVSQLEISRSVFREQQDNE